MPGIPSRVPFVRFIGDYDIIPFGWGVGGRCWNRRAYWCMPLPFNWPARLILEAWCWLTGGPGYTLSQKERLQFKCMKKEVAWLRTEIRRLRGDIEK
jgi:hypothetical protein